MNINDLSSIATIVEVFFAPLIGFGIVWIRRVSKATATIERRSQELEHNHGGSMKDFARDARLEAIRSREVSERALEVALQRIGAEDAKFAKLQHDLSNVRQSSAMLADIVQRINEDRLRKEQQWVEFFQAMGMSPPKPTSPFLRGDDD